MVSVYDLDALAEFDALIEGAESGGIVLDLTDVTLVTREGVDFIRRAVARGADLMNCPPYVVRWIAGEEDEPR